MQHINKRIAEFKKEDGNLYAIYGTPAESLCGLQIEQFRKLYASSRMFRIARMFPIPSTAM